MKWQNPYIEHSSCGAMLKNGITCSLLLIFRYACVLGRKNAKFKTKIMWKLKIVSGERHQLRRLNVWQNIPEITSLTLSCLPQPWNSYKKRLNERNMLRLMHCTILKNNWDTFENFPFSEYCCLTRFPIWKENPKKCSICILMTNSAVFSSAVQILEW